MNTWDPGIALEKKNATKNGGACVPRERNDGFFKHVKTVQRKYHKLKEIKQTLANPRNMTKIKKTGDECTQCAEDLKRQNEERNVGGSNCEEKGSLGAKAAMTFVME